MADGMLGIPAQELRGEDGRNGRVDTAQVNSPLTNYLITIPPDFIENISVCFFCRSVKLHPSKSFDVSSAVRDMSMMHSDKRGVGGDKVDGLRRGNSSDAVRFQFLSWASSIIF